MKTPVLLFLALIILFSSCVKKAGCSGASILKATSITPTVGDNVTITAPFHSSNDVYQWNGPGVNQTNQSTTLQLDDIKLSQSGIYSFVAGGNGECDPLSDTILITVKMKQETAPCTLTANSAVFSGMANATFLSVTQGFDPTWEAVSLYAYAGFGQPNITMLFNSYNGNTEPLDGTHITAEGPSFNILQEPNEVSLSFIYGSNYYHSRPGHKVYVSHINGKLKVSFCNVIFYSSTVPLITSSATMTEL